MKEIGFALYIFISLVYGLPIGTHVTVRAKKNPSVDRIIVNVRKRRSKYWDFWEVNNSKSCIYSITLFKILYKRNDILCNIRILSENSFFSSSKSFALTGLHNYVVPFSKFECCGNILNDYTTI